MKGIKVRIKGKLYDFALSSTLGALVDCEKVVGEAYDNTKTLHTLALYYATLARSNEADFTLGFDEFLLSMQDKELAKRITGYFWKRWQILEVDAKVENGEQPSDEDDDKKKE